MDRHVRFARPVLVFCCALGGVPGPGAVAEERPAGSQPASASDGNTVLAADGGLLTSELLPKWKQLRGTWRLEEGVLRCRDAEGLIAAPPVAGVRNLSFEARGDEKAKLRVDAGRFSVCLDFPDNRLRVACMSPGFAFSAELAEKDWHKVELLHRIEGLEAMLDANRVGLFPLQPAGGRIGVQVTGGAAIRELRTQPAEGTIKPMAIHPDLADALREANEKKKLLLVDFYGKWCPWCVRMDKVFAAGPVKKVVAEEFHYVKLDIGRFERHKECTAYYGIRSIPIIVVFHSNGSPLNALSGYRPEKIFSKFLTDTVTKSKDPEAGSPKTPPWMQPPSATATGPDSLVSCGRSLEAVMTLLEQRDPNIADTLRLSSALEQRGLDAWAAEVCDAGLKRDHGSDEGQKLALHRAHLAWRLGDPEEALNLVQRAKDTSESTLVLQGDAYGRLRRGSLAVGAWRNVLQLNPLRDDVVDRLKAVRAAAKRHDGALELKKAVDLVKPTVAVITGAGGCGSGFFLTPDGLLVTNLHVTVKALEPKVTAIFPDEGAETRETFPVAGVLAADMKLDLAVVRVVPRGRRFRPLRLAQGDIPDLGSRIFVIGSPLGLDYTVTQGIVSSGLREFPNGARLVQTDATFEPGVSGGPICNYNGEVIGVAAGVMGKIGFFIPTTAIHDFLKREGLPPVAAPTSPSARPKVRPIPKPRPESQPAEDTPERQAANKLVLARNYLRAGLKESARKILKSIVAEYPGTSAAGEAKEELEKLE